MAFGAPAVERARRDWWGESLQRCGVDPRRRVAERRFGALASASTGSPQRSAMALTLAGEEAPDRDHRASVRILRQRRSVHVVFKHAAQRMFAVRVEGELSPRSSGVELSD